MTSSTSSEREWDITPNDLEESQAILRLNWLNDVHCEPARFLSDTTIHRPSMVIVFYRAAGPINCIISEEKTTRRSQGSVKQGNTSEYTAQMSGESSAGRLTVILSFTKLFS